MKLKKIHLSNFRGFRDFEMTFNTQTTVIIGHNGSGKTTILDSIAICMTHLTGKLFSSDEGYNIDAWFTPQDIANEESTGSCKIVVQDEHFNNSQDFLIQVKKNRNEKGLNFDISPDSFFIMIKENLLNNEINSLPIIVYYNVNRTYSKGVDLSKPKKTYNKLLFAYEKSLVLRSPNFKTFENWFQQQVIEENAYKVRKGNLKIELPNLKYVRHALNKFLSIIQPDTFGAISTRMESVTLPDFEVRSSKYLLIEKNGREMLLNQLSDGERMVIGLVAEISRRLVIANNTEPLKGTGIVLIDEIELHLHPKWQRTIVGALEKTFPNITFILTSHSPLVLSGLRKSSIKIINDSQEVPNGELPDIYTATADEILERLMFAEDSFNPFKEQLKEIDKLFNDLKFDEADEKLQIIKSDLKSSPEWLRDYEERIEFAKA